MGKPKGKGSVFAKAFTVLAVAFVIGLGLCGLDYLLAANGIGKSREEFGVGPLDAVSLVVMILSAIGLVIATVAWLLVTLVRVANKNQSEQQKPLDDRDEFKHHDQ